MYNYDKIAKAKQFTKNLKFFLLFYYKILN